MPITYTSKRKIHRVVLLGSATLLALLFFTPVVYTVSTSFKSLHNIFEFPIRWIPETFHWNNYLIPLKEKDFALYFVNSMIVATIVTASSMVFGSMAGYSLTKFNYPGRQLFFGLVLVVMMIPIEVVLVPLAIIARKLGLINTRAGLILPVLISPMAIFWMRQYILTIPIDYLEAARVEGLGEVMLFFKIILPMSLPALGALAIFSFMTNWNSLMWPLVATSTKAVRTVPVAIVSFQGEFEVAWNELFAMSVLSTLPLVIVFLAAREKLIEGLAIGGLKG